MSHPDDAFALAPALRDVDKKELTLTWDGSADVGELLQKSVEVSDVTYTISDTDGRIHGIWGHGPWLSGPVRPGLGYVWLVSDDELFRKHGIAMTRHARNTVFPFLDRTYSAYGNFVLSENLVHARWLLRGGFKRVAPVQLFNESWGFYLRYGSSHRRLYV